MDGMRCVVMRCAVEGGKHECPCSAGCFRSGEAYLYCELGYLSPLSSSLFAPMFDQYFINSSDRAFPPFVRMLLCYRKSRYIAVTHPG